MGNKNTIIWWYSIQFLNFFRSLYYDSVPLNILLLRDFQKYISGRYYKLSKKAFNQIPLINIQAECEDFLIKNTPDLTKNGYILLRSNLFHLAEGITDQKFILLAHYKKEYLKAKEKLKSEQMTLIYLNNFPEAEVPIEEEINLNQNLRYLLSLDKSKYLFNDDHFKKWLIKKVKKTLVLIRRTHALFSKYPIKQTIYGSTINRHGALITTFAQTRNIHTVNIQHGVLGDIGHFPVNADLNLIWGKAEMEYYSTHRVSQAKLEVIGPYFIRSQEQDSLKENKRKEEKGKLRVLVAMQPLGYLYNKKMILTIEKAAKSLPKINIKYKLHPDQLNTKIYKKLLLRNESEIIAHGKIPLNNLMLEADLIITPYSTVAYEAILYKKPVIFYGHYQNYYYLKGKTSNIDNVPSTRSLFKRLLNKPLYLGIINRRLKLKDSAPVIKNRREIWGIIQKYFEVGLDLKLEEGKNELWLL